LGTAVAASLSEISVVLKITGLCSYMLLSAI
jgi:hypothetical protein